MPPRSAWSGILRKALRMCMRRRSGVPASGRQSKHNLERECSSYPVAYSRAAGECVLHSGSPYCGDIENDMDEAASFGKRGRSMLDVETLRAGTLRGVARCYCETCQSMPSRPIVYFCLRVRCNSLVARGVGLDIARWDSVRCSARSLNVQARTANELFCKKTESSPELYLRLHCAEMHRESCGGNHDFGRMRFAGW